jgi:hypothetical protein
MTCASKQLRCSVVHASTCTLNTTSCPKKYKTKKPIVRPN